MNPLHVIGVAILLAASQASAQDFRQRGGTARPRIPVTDSMIHLRVESQEQSGNFIEYTVRGERGNPNAGRAYASAKQVTAEPLRFDSGSRLSSNTVQILARDLEEIAWDFYRLGPAVAVDAAGRFTPYTNGVYEVSDGREVIVDSLPASLMEARQRLNGTTYELTAKLNVREQGLYSLRAQIAGVASAREVQAYLLPGEQELAITVPDISPGQLLRWDNISVLNSKHERVAAMASGTLAGLVVSGSDWTLSSIGAAAAGTLSSTSGSDLVMTGDECCFGGTADITYFASRTLTGDGTLTGKLTVMNSANGRAGIMMRNDTTPGSAMVALYLSEDLKAYALSRSSAGQPAVTLASVDFDGPPYWFKLVRIGQNVSLYISSDGASWRRLAANFNTTLNGTVEAGFFANGGATFENPALTTGLVESVAVSASLAEVYSMNGTGAKLRVLGFGPTGTGSLTFSATGLPAGVTANFGVATGIRGATASTVGIVASDLTLTASSSVPQGTYPVTIRATDGTRSGSVVVQLRVTPGFNVEWPVSPSWLLDVPGSLYGAPRVVSGTSSSYSFTVPVTYVGGYAGLVDIYAADDISASRGIAPTQAGATANIAISIKGDALKMTNGLHYLKFQAIGTDMSQQMMIPMELGPDFLMCCIPGTTMTTAAGGSSSSYSISSFTRANGHSDPIQLSISGFPAGVTATFGTNPVTTSTTSSSATFSASSSVTAGTYSGFIVQTSPSVTRMTPWSLQVTGGSSFSVSASPASTTVAQGATVTLTGSFTQAQGSSTSVTFSVTGLPTGATATFNPTSRTSTGTTTISIATTSSTPAGTYSLVFRGTAGSTVQQATPVTLIVSPAFTVQASPTAVSVMAGASSTVGINVANAPTTAALSVSGLPTGVTAAFAPTSVTGSGSSTLTLTVAPTAASGVSTLTISAVDGTTTKTATVSLTIQSYSLSATPASASVTAGASVNYTVALSMLNGFSNSVTFSASGLPAGATATFNPATLAASGNTTLTVSTTSSVTAGTYPLTITGTSGAVTKTASVSLVVSGAASGALSVTRSAATLTVIASRSGTNTITVANAPAGTTTLSVAGLPVGATAVFSPVSLAPNGTSTLTIATSATTPGGSSTITVNATNGTSTVATTFTLTVQSFTISNPAAITVAKRKSGSTTVTLTMTGGFAGSVAFSVSGLPPGVSASWTPTSRTSTGTTTLKLTVGSTAAVGTFPLTVRGTHTGSGFTLGNSAPLNLVVN